MKSFYINRFPILYGRQEGDPEKLGVYIGMKHDQEGFVKKWAVVMMNFHNSPMAFDYRHSQEEESISDVVQAQQIVLIEGSTVEILMSRPTLHFSLAEITTASTDYKEKEKRIQKKHITRLGDYNAQLDLHLHSFLEFPWPEPKPKKSLKEYTQNIARDIKNRPSQKIDPNDPARKAGFSDTLDLHAHQLLDNPQDYTSTELLIMQLQKFESFLDEALAIGFDKITVIHGVGKGKLREEIFNILNNHPFVSKYKNEFHPKYKFGATEIFLKE